MKRLLPLLFLALATTLTAAETPAAAYPRTIFSDDFSDTEFGKRWGHYKSGSVIKEGVLVGITPEGSDHSAVDNIKFDPERDLEVSVKFKFVSDKAKSFGLWFDDKDYKGSHAGHLCQVVVAPKNVTLSDAKTGGFDLTNGLYDRKKENKLTPEEKTMLATKSKNFPSNLSLNEWHKLVAQTKGDELVVSIDGQAVGSFKSEGVAHDHKTLVSLTTNQIDVQYDDFSLKGAAKP